jgi:hypothetical protein
MSATTRVSWDLDPDLARELAEAVEDLGASSGRPHREVLEAIIRAGLDSPEAVQVSLGRRHLHALLAALPPDFRPVPAVSAYDQLLSRRDVRSG